MFWSSILLSADSFLIRGFMLLRSASVVLRYATPKRFEFVGSASPGAKSSVRSLASDCACIFSINYLSSQLSYNRRSSCSHTAQVPEKKKTKLFLTSILISAIFRDDETTYSSGLA